MERGVIVLVDTNIIIEAFRVRCWKAITSHYVVETVEKCYEEALTGDPLRPGYVKVDPEEFRKGLRNRHNVVNIERMKLSLRATSANSLDAGERDLLAHACNRTDAWSVSCADRAAVNTALTLGWETNIVSLEQLTQFAGAKPTLKHNFTERWLSEVRTTFKLAQPL